MGRDCLEFEPEPIESLRARYHHAVDTLVDIESVCLGSAYDPGAFREHVFDLEDRFRIVISREDQGIEGKVLHMSASLDESFPDEVIDLGTDHLIDLIEKRFREISGDTRKFGIRVGTPDGILHWYIFEDPKKNENPGEIEFTL